MSAAPDQGSMEKPEQRSGEKSQKTEKLSINQRLNEFVQKNRKGLFLGLVAVIILLVGSIITLTVREKINTNAFSKVDAFNQRYEELKTYIGSEAPDAASRQTEIEALLNELESFAAGKSGFAAARAYSVSAGIYEAEKKWAEAEKAWIDAAKAAGKSYLAPISLYNAAVAAEEQGNTESAIELYNQTLNYENGVLVAVRAQFSIGRLEESRNNREAALEAYKSLVGKWPMDPLWANLAQNRIMILSD